MDDTLTLTEPVACPGDVVARPILFSAPMVRACMREIDPKTQTRRIVKFAGLLDFEKGTDGIWHFRTEGGVTVVRCPYGVPGDTLWVRETYRFGGDWTETLPPRECSGAAVMYPATERRVNEWGRLRPSIHMPRWASRITLKITDVRVERLNEISREDAAAEGLVKLPASGRYVVAKGDQYFGSASHDPREVYSWLWEDINGEGSWAANPWVWAVSFTIANAPEGA